MCVVMETHLNVQDCIICLSVTELEFNITMHSATLIISPKIMHPAT